MKAKKRLGIFFRALAIVLLVTPIFALAIYKKDIWIINDYTTDKISLGLIIALLFCLGLLKGAFKSLDKRLITAGSLLTFAVIVWLFDSIIDDLFWIILCAFVGYIFYLIFDGIGSNLYKKSKIYEEENIRTQARKDYDNTQVKGSGRA